MKKRFLSMAAVAFALSISTGMTAFAGSWKSDENGKYYENDNGSRPVYAGWFTDPADGVMYYMDPDGYAMTNTKVEGYRLDDEGRRIEKTEEEIQREAARKAELASRPSPAKKAAAAEVAADAAKNAVAATTTGRTSYQSEMKVFMDKYFIEAGKACTNTDITGTTDEDNTEITYAFKTSDGYHFLEATEWLSVKASSTNYKPQAFDLFYNFNAMGGEEATIFGNAFNQMVIAAVGETEGQAVIDAINEARNAGTATFNRSGNTDAGNTYTLTYNNGSATLSVTCSEQDSIAAEAEQAKEEAEAAAETAAEQTTTSSVLVAGQSASSAE
ncbi:hypothetical protein [Brotaphodocola sp.]|uniref:hypothetical protein n=1 Tax=Brotaphodocola sp. TaxID=3073577 RepID=UPI003D7D4BF6